MQEDEVVHVPSREEQGEEETERVPGLGETATLPGGGITVGDSVPDMPPGSSAEDIGRTMSNAAASETGGDLDATDLGQPTSTADTTGDRATGLTSLRGQ